MAGSISFRLLIGSTAVALAFGGCALEGQPDDSSDAGEAGDSGSGGASAGKGGSSNSGGTVGSPTAGKSGTGGSSKGGAGGSATGGTGGGAGGTPGAGSGGASNSGSNAGGTAGESSSGGASGADMGGAGGASAGSSGSAGVGGSGGGAGGASSGKSAGCGKAPTIASNMYNNGQPIAITAAGIERRYILSVPTNYDNMKPYKLVIAFHQRDGNDRQMYANDYYHLLDLSDDNAIFVAPNGQKNGAPCTTMNNGDSGCGWPNPGGEDIALSDAVVAQVKENFCIDDNRIFATGWSYGGSMSYKTACERGLGGTKGGVAGYIRGIAVYSGAELSGNCTPSTPVAYYGSHGDNDGVLDYDLGAQLAENFATENGCTWMTPAKVTSGNHMCTDIMGCPAQYPVKFCSFDGDHTPDPRDPNQQSSWQYQLVWDWFDQF
jgi:poly(3-hydroxybutyrate) depolymerase